MPQEASDQGLQKQVSAAALLAITDPNEFPPLNPPCLIGNGKDPKFMTAECIRTQSDVKPILRKRRSSRGKAVISVSKEQQYPSKSVKFNKDIENIRYFRKQECPAQVAEHHTITSTGNDDQDELLETSDRKWIIRKMPPLNNAIFEPRCPVRLESLRLSADNTTVIVIVGVLNLAFHKEVTIRFSWDDWETVSDQIAEFQPSSVESSQPKKADRFIGRISLPDDPTARYKTMNMCIRYRVDGKEFWNNNDGQNYRASFAKRKPEVMPRQQAAQPPKEAYGSSLKTPWTSKTAGSAGTKATKSNLHEQKKSSSLRLPAYQNATLDSEEYREMLEKYCYFRPRMVTPV